MDFIDQLRGMSSQIATHKDAIQTEEATKNAMVMPFIQLLGYNVFNPTEVTPELVADVGTKKGEKVDYAILRDGKPIMLFECKKSGGDLNINHAGQLFRYFHVTEARFGVLTNGLVYRFFTDLEQPNKMDEKPFFEFNILDFKDRDVEQLKKFAKSTFDLDTILNTASELKYTRVIQNKLADLMATPSEDFVKIVSSELMAGKRFTPALKEQFTLITRRAFEQLVGERINERLKGAMTPDPTPILSTGSSTEPEANPQGASAETQGVVTTSEELEAFHSIRAMVRDLVPAKRVAMRDAQSYCAVLLDDNNRKPICRLRFNNTQRLRVGLFNEKREEEIVSIDSVDDIFNLADRLRTTIAGYLSASGVLAGADVSA